jgi:hypothetical protein
VKNEHTLVTFYYCFYKHQRWKLKGRIVYFGSVFHRVQSLVLGFIDVSGGYGEPNIIMIAVYEGSWPHQVR